MFELMMVIALSQANPTQMAGPFQPCIWPRCAKPEAVVAEIQPCIWPKCFKPGTELVDFGISL